MKDGNTAPVTKEVGVVATSSSSSPVHTSVDDNGSVSSDSASIMTTSTGAPAVKIVSPAKRRRSSLEVAQDVDIKGIRRVESAVQDYFDSTLNTVEWRTSNLNVQPGDSYFVFWFVLSSYFPLVSSCIGPLSNMFSIFAIVCSWKIRRDVDDIYSEYQGTDEAWVYIVNSISMCVAMMSNFMLILNYRKKLRYAVSQVISISGWFVASVMLTVLIVIYHKRFYDKGLDKDYEITYGFYFACITVCLHFGNFIFLFMNELGFLMKKYKPVFNVNDVQKSLIFQVGAMAVWLMIGSGVFVKMFKIPFGFALYYCIVSVVTVGEQQDVPYEAAAQGVSSFWIMVALVIFGLIVSSVLDTIIEFSSSTLYWHRLRAVRDIRLKLKRSEIVSNEDAFDFMRSVDDIADLSQKLLSLCMILIVFLLIFLCGGLGISLFEGWPFSLGCYFCFCVLVTLGCGNYAPVTAGGRALFCIWALASIPSMTTLISNLSELVFGRLKKINDIDFYDVFYDIAANSKHMRLIARIFSSRHDSIGIQDLENLMDETSLGIQVGMRRTVDLDHTFSDVVDDEPVFSSGDELEMLSFNEHGTEQTAMIDDDDDEDNNSGGFSVAGLAIPHRLRTNISKRSNKSSKSSKSHRSSGVLSKNGLPDQCIPESVYASAPLPTHPVDTIFEYIINNKKLSNLDFITASQFVDRISRSIHLANYSRDNAHVTSYSDNQIRQARLYLLKALRDIDPGFSVSHFLDTYQLMEGPNPKRPLLTEKPWSQCHYHLSVLRMPQYRITTMFQKKNDFVLNNMSTLQILMTELKKSLFMICFKPNFRYNFEDWDRFMRLTQNADYLEDNENGDFWIGERSPLCYPNYEPQYFAMTYLRHIETKLHRFSWEYDKSKYHLSIDMDEKSVSN